MTVSVGTGVSILKDKNSAWDATVPGDGFIMAGASLDRVLGYATRTVPANTVKVDHIYFPETTTIDQLVVMTAATASAGGTLTVGLHPVVKRGNYGVQSFTADITIAAAANTTHTAAVSWTIPAGWYALTTWTAVAITNLNHGDTGSARAGTIGTFNTLGYITFASTQFEVEAIVAVVFKDDYDTSPDLTAIDFNDTTSFTATAAVNGDIAFVEETLLLGLRVA